ncbi:hypothetical protein [Thalassospira xiamenensis]|uniref:hypothetical protein n=1 Tax=Thalassospira xiamenensis TaxID=220697 RepID=UPI0020005A65|nr:hypothetical protein [Thalassospira xiamenensis]MCK2165755.1 hypothetical protein [Thalassospira xiamenensis]
MQQWQIPDPHPLDCDWRYSSNTAMYLANISRNHKRILLVGAPTVARLMKNDKDLILIDRQPFQGITQHIAIEPMFSNPKIGKFDLAIIDPPWYIEDAKKWLLWTLQYVALNSTILMTIWPKSFRPKEYIETREILKFSRHFGTAKIMDKTTHYETPIFENFSIFAAGKETALSRSPRKGRIIEIKNYKTVKSPPTSLEKNKWHRITLNNYQISIKIKPETTNKKEHYNKENTVKYWPYVSRRAPGIEKITMISSNNEFSTTNTSEIFDFSEKLRILEQSHPSRIYDFLKSHHLTKSFDIPSPPYWRIKQWQHH